MLIIAKFPGRCQTCKEQIYPGDKIVWKKRRKREGYKNRTWHIKCYGS